MSTGTCRIPQVACCAAGCMGPPLILRLYAKLVLSNAQRKAPRLHKNSTASPPRHTHTHTHWKRPSDICWKSRLIYLRRHLIGIEVVDELVDAMAATLPTKKVHTLHFLSFLLLRGQQSQNWTAVNTFKVQDVLAFNASENENINRQVYVSTVCYKYSYTIDPESAILPTKPETRALCVNVLTHNNTHENTWHLLQKQPYIENYKHSYTRTQ